MRIRPSACGCISKITINNTVAASPRVLIPILEMHQQADGRIRIPEALQPYLNGRTMIGD